MKQELLNEGLISLNEATRVLPKFNGKPPHHGTLWRWCTIGIKGVQLEHVRVGRRICTSVQELNRFMLGVADASQVDIAHVNGSMSIRDASEPRKNASEAARTALQREGFTS